MYKKIKPITPKAVRESKQERIPDQVINIFNELILEKWDGDTAIIYQEDIVNRIVEEMEVSPDVIFNKHWLDIEFVYSKFGWHVQYEKQTVEGNGKSYFIFTVNSE